ncbi:MAG: hypothetical protein RLZZ165_1872 [Bacteroidota bacterium]|jgi:D-sedoheptulose 7-phosphate isomerase
MHDRISQLIQDAIKVKLQTLQDGELLSTVEKVVRQVVKTLKSDGKVLLCGNGGSAADAQHIAAELSGRFYLDRDPLFSEALHVNTSYLTAVANDYGYDQVYSRLVRAKGRKGDVLFAISTSGNSANILEALKAARQIGMATVSMTGLTGGKMREMSDHLLNVPSTDTPRIQEVHILLGHIICELVESELFPQ